MTKKLNMLAFYLINKSVAIKNWNKQIGKKEINNLLFFVNFPKIRIQSAKITIINNKQINKKYSLYKNT